MKTLRAEDFDACSEGSEAPVVSSDLLQMCSDPHKPQNCLLGWGQGRPAWVDTEVVVLLFG